MQFNVRPHVRYNFAVNIADGAFFGFGLGIASYVTIIPLFVSTLTDSNVLIGLISAMHLIGWQLPQILTAERVARLRRYKPMVLFMTLHERAPFFALALLALAVPVISRELALVLAFAFVGWQAFGGGFTATAWMSMIAKIMPPRLRGTFYGMQSAAGNLLSSGGAVLAGVILETINSPQSYALCFGIAGVVMFISLGFLAASREEEAAPARETARPAREMWRDMGGMVRHDSTLRAFIMARLLSQFALVGVSFYAVYVVRSLNADAGIVGVMTGVLLMGQTIASPIFGAIGDRWSHRAMFALGGVLVSAAALVALLAPDASWFYIVFALTGIGQAGLWTTVNALTADFGTEATRPYYIGLSNTLVAPGTLAAPLIGGWLADTSGHPTTFLVGVIAGLLTAVVVLLMRDPREQHPQTSVQPAPVNA